MPPIAQADVDFKVLKSLYAKNPVATAAIDYFSGRQYNPRHTKVDLLIVRLAQRGSEFGRGEVIEFFRQLEKTGAGRFVIGRRGQPTRFEWDVQAISAAKAAKGEVGAVEVLPPGTPANDDDDEDEVPAGMIRHFFRLRQDQAVQFDLPENLTEKEASRLGEFIKTLPFDSVET
jgi:hypothetical protein